jgi:exopolyphosphatase / guanosine-5'-triphosphate,3'-diphosphate pyrophosphatase
LTPTDSQESDELYLVADAPDNVKIRDGKMDIKVLREVNADGLQRWEPVLKAAFPLAATEIARVFEALQQPTPALARESYTMDEFLDELVKPNRSIGAVNVHKRRTRYTYKGCSSELDDLTANRRSTRSVAIESEDPSAVSAAIRSAGLDGWLNASYVRALRDLVDGVPPRHAVIDCGTNSIKLHIAERLGPGAWRAVLDRSEITRLGEGLKEGGEIRPEAMERTAGVIRSMAEEAREHDVRAIVAAGTAGLRMASNVDEVLAAIRERGGVSVEVIPGDEEARLAYLAVAASLDLGQGSLALFDTGGGSSQFTFGHGEQVDEQFSVNVGAARYTERFGLNRVVSEAVVGDTLAAIADDLSRLDGRPRPDSLVGLGGAVTNISAVKHGLKTYDPEVIQGSVIERAEIDRQIELYRTRDAEERRSIAGLQRGREEVILAGACIMRTVMEKLEQDSLTVSDRGLRHGLLMERFG